MLVRALVHTGVHAYLEFKAVDGSYVMKQGKTYKVPANDMDALKSSLMGMFEKRRARSFFIFVQEYDPGVPSTHGAKDLFGNFTYYDLDALTSRQLFEKFVEPNTVDFIGHALALYTDDAYLDPGQAPGDGDGGEALLGVAGAIRHRLAVHLPVVRPRRAPAGASPGSARCTAGRTC